VLVTIGLGAVEVPVLEPGGGEQGELDARARVETNPVGCQLGSWAVRPFDPIAPSAAARSLCC
jgi:hypothetical protein